ncbi:MAG: ABC transporter substrate-binding protein [Gluconacetobacter diazotrophicus]|nr:ABC transporter substrate-binding protein [Gluconacetobacter diazotrophicus]
MGVFRLMPVLALALAMLPWRAGAADRLTLLLDWFVNSNHAAILTAESSGAFAKEGLEVALVEPADPTAPPRLLAAGRADLCIGYQTELPFDVAGGLGILRVGTLEDAPLNTLIAAGNGPVRTIADLKGKRIGMSANASDRAIVGAMLRSAGLTMADVVPTEVNFQIEQGLLTGRVDAVLGMRNYELIDLRMRGAAPRDFDPERYGVPPYDELIVLARKGMAHDDRVVRFMRALKAGTATLLVDPEAAWRAAVKQRPELDTALNHAAWTETLPVLARDPAALDPARYAALQRFEHEQGALDKVLPVAEIATVP